LTAIILCTMRPPLHHFGSTSRTLPMWTSYKIVWGSRKMADFVNKNESIKKSWTCDIYYVFLSRNTTS
jgi:hypothetical protein